jgi:hypothetical protein
MADPLALASAARNAADRRLQEKPVNGVPTGGVGVFSGDLKTAGGANRPWQERYGHQGTRDTSPAKPFHHGGTVDSKDLKPWQASRLRGLEARGYEFKPKPTKTGADYGGDAFCGAKATIELQPEDDIASYTPYLVSGKVKSADMRQMFQDRSHAVEAITPKYAFSPIPAGGGDQNLPYCDL